MTMDPVFLSRAEAAKRAGVAVSTIAAWERKGLLKARRVNVNGGVRVRIRADELARVLNTARGGSDDDPTDDRHGAATDASPELDVAAGSSDRGIRARLKRERQARAEAERHVKNAMTLAKRERRAREQSEEKLAELSATVHWYRDHLQTLRERLEDRQQEIAGLRRQNKAMARDLEGELRAEKEARERADDELLAATQRLERLKDRDATSRKELRTAIEERDRVRAELEQARRAIVTEVEVRERAVREAADREHREREEALRAEMQRTGEELRAAAAGQLAERDRVHAETSQQALEAHERTVRELHAGAEALVAQARQELDEQRALREAADERVRQQENLLEETRAERDERERVVSELQADLAAREARSRQELEDREQELREWARRELEQRESELREWARRELEERESQIRDERRGLQAQEQALRETASRELQAQEQALREAAVRELEERERTLSERASAEREDAERALRAARAELEAARTEAREIAEREGRLRDEARAELAQREEQLRAWARSELAAQEQALREAAVRELEERERTLSERASAEREEAERALRAARAELDAARTELEALRADARQFADREGRLRDEARAELAQREEQLRAWARRELAAQEQALREAAARDLADRREEMLEQRRAERQTHEHAINALREAARSAEAGARQDLQEERRLRGEAEERVRRQEALIEDVRRERDAHERTVRELEASLADREANARRELEAQEQAMREAGARELAEREHQLLAEAQAEREAHEIAVRELRDAAEAIGSNARLQLERREAELERERKALEEELGVHQARAEAFYEQLTHRQQLLEQLQRANDELEDTAAGHRSREDEIRQAMARHERARDQAEREKKAMEDALIASAAREAELAERAMREREAFEAKVEEEAGRVQKLLQEIDRQQTAAMDVLRRQKVLEDELEAERARTETIRDAGQRERQTLTQKLAARQARIESLETSLANEGRSRSEAEAQLETLRTTIDEHDARRREEKEIALEKRRALDQALRRRSEEEQERLAVLERENRELTDQLARTERELEERGVQTERPEREHARDRATQPDRVPATVTGQQPRTPRRRPPGRSRRIGIAAWARSRVGDRVRSQAAASTDSGGTAEDNGSRLAAWGSSAWIAVPVIFNLVVLRAERTVVQNVNDGSLHAAMIRWASAKFASGRLPLDGWFPFLTTGTPLFHNYQSLPHIVTGLFGSLFGGGIAYSWSLYLLLALWPIAVYGGARLLGWDRGTAIAAAVVAPLIASAPGYGYEFGSYTFAGLGVWSQLWGMWLLPLALGLSWRAIDQRRGLVAAALALSLTLVGHVITGYFALLALGVWVVSSDSTRLRIRVARAAAVGSVALVAGAWLLVPVVVDRRWIVSSGFASGFWRDSYGLRSALTRLVTGGLFDHAFAGGRLPVVTALVFVGLATCILRFRRDVRARALVGLFGLSLFLFAGRRTFGAIIDLLPGSSGLLFHRYILAVHISGLLLAGVGAVAVLSAIAGVARRVVPRLTPAVAVAATAVVATAVLAPAWVERARYAEFSGDLIEQQETREVVDARSRDRLIALAKQLGDGRVYAGLPTNWGKTYAVGFVPGYTSLLNNDVDGIGFTLRVGSMVNGVEPYLNDTNRHQLDVLGIRYLLLPRTRQPSVPADVIESRGQHVLWEIRGATGYMRLVDTVDPISVRQSSAKPLRDFLASPDLPRGLHPTVRYAGVVPDRSTTTRAGAPSGSPGSVRPVDFDPDGGVFRAEVTARRRSAVMLKASFHGRWRVTIDGKEARKYIVAPGYPAVTVPRGSHDVEFRYMPYPAYPWLSLLGLAALIALYIATTTGRSRRRHLASAGLLLSRIGIGQAPARTRTGVSSPDEGDLADEGGDDALLLPQPHTLHRDEEEQQEEGNVEGEVDPTTDADQPREPAGEARIDDGDDEAREQQQDDEAIAPGGTSAGEVQRADGEEADESEDLEEGHRLPETRSRSMSTAPQDD